MPASTIKPGLLFIGGQWVESAAGATFRTINPATEEPLTEVAEGCAEDIDRAVTAARKAFSEGAWPRMPAADRGRLLWKIGDML
ncbi:MAG: aldehyde dehydrogenase family protein, partial [Acidobacteria bacterium]|nr:aldehyde dehydrogenase family protein [Acidobacteriota bacterium]